MTPETTQALDEIASHVVALCKGQPPIAKPLAIMMALLTVQTIKLHPTADLQQIKDKLEILLEGLRPPEMRQGNA